jgi:glutathione S-transferase
MRVYGSQISYFTGKLEAYLRYKEIPYTFVPMTARHFNRTVPRATGAAQMPAVELPDGRWMTDTTPIIAWFERERPDPAVIPRDPLQAFMSRLLEDYADEWMWRPAMHYRWSYRPDALLLSRMIATELLPDVPLPGFLKRWGLRQRQWRGYVRGDGVTAATRPHVEGLYVRTLASLESIFATRPYLLGAAPTLADFGFFASMFRHFGLDPTASAIMRTRAPGVYAWVARLWTARASRTQGVLLEGVPVDWSPLLEDAGTGYIPFLAANATAWKARHRRFDVEVQGTTYRRLPTSRYRVWCLEELRRRYEELPAATAAAARTQLERHHCWEPLWRVASPESGHDPERRAPFGRGLRVF